MTPSRRERLIAVAAVLAVACLAADRYVVTPLLDANAALAAEQERLVARLTADTALLQHRRTMDRKWREMTAGGLASDPSAAEGRALHALQNWARDAGLALSSVKPEHADVLGRIGTITVLASGTGTMGSVSKFLWLVETAPLPLRVHELQVGSRTEGADDLSVQMKLSTLYVTPAAPEAAAAPGEGP